MQPLVVVEPDPGEVRSRRGLRVALASFGLVLAAISLVLLVWGEPILLFLTRARFETAPPAAAAGDAAQAERQDIEQFGHFADLDAGLSGDARTAIDAERQKLLARAGGLGSAQLAMGVAHAAALAGNLDSNADLASVPVAVLPVRFQWFAEGLYVVASQASAAALLGARVETIGGRTPDEVVAAFRPYHGGGTAGAARAAALAVLQSPALQAVLWPAQSPSEAALHLALPDGTAKDTTLAALRAPAGPWQELALPAVPLSLRDRDQPVVAKPVGDGLYLRLGDIRDTAAAERQFRAAIGGFAPGSMRWAVLDLRWTGAKQPFLPSVIQDFASRIEAEGHAFVLTGAGTGSGGVAVIAWAKNALGARAVIEGEVPGQVLSYWSAEGAPLVLPNSGLRVSFATAFHDWQNGCRSLSCYWPDLFYGATVPTLEPDVAVHWRFEDYRQGIDTALGRLAEMTKIRELSYTPPKRTD